MRSLIIVALLCILLAPVMPAHADSTTAQANALAVDKAYGNHAYILSGETWHYVDHRLDIFVREVVRWDGKIDRTITVTRLGDGRIVGSWSHVYTLVYIPGNWENYLATLAAGIPPK